MKLLPVSLPNAADLAYPQRYNGPNTDIILLSMEPREMNIESCMVIPFRKHWSDDKVEFIKVINSTSSILFIIYLCRIHYILL